MYKYLVLDIGFMLIAASLACQRITKLDWKNVLRTLIILVTMTAIFDQFLIGLHIVSYHTNLLLGAYLYKVPIEDFAYTLATALIMPALWQKAKHDK